MSLSDLASLGSFVSGVAVVVTLVFLLLQMRQSDKNQRAVIRMSRATRANDLYAMMASPDVAAVLAKAWPCEADLSEADAIVLMGFSGALLRNWEDTYYQYRAGTVDKAIWESEEAGIRTALAIPAHRAMWQILQSTHGDEFRRYIEKVLTKVPAGRSGVSAFYNMMAQQQLARANAAAPEGVESRLALAPNETSKTAAPSDGTR